MSKIKSIRAREILNSKGQWTIEAEVETELGVFEASVPSGTSKGKYEAVEIECQKAVENIERIIAPELKGEDVTEQEKIDRILIDLDGTENKSKLGANTILAVSVALSRAGGCSAKLPLYSYISKSYEVQPRQIMPLPCFNVLNGGAHAGNDLDIQEFMVVPSSESFKKNLQVGVEIYQHLKRTLEKKLGKFAINVGYEGGFVPPIKKTKEALDLLMEAIKEAGYENKVNLGLDCAASEFCRNGKYNFEGEKLNEEKLLEFYKELIKKYPISFLEDPFSQDDWQSWQRFVIGLANHHDKVGGKSTVLVVGDDLTVTSLKRMELAKKKNACNGVIIKPNQIGTVTETIKAVKLAKQFGWKVIVSHRSGDTGDNFISDLAVGINADFIKAGAPARGERVTKYNRLLRIEEELRS